MRRIVLTLFLSGGMTAFGQGGSFHLSGETADGEAITLPEASAGKHCIIAIAASRKAEPLLQEWYEPAYLRFVSQVGLFAGEVDCDLWLVPVFTGLNKAAFGPSMERLKKEADPEMARRVVFVKDDAGALLDALGIKDRDQPYFFVIGPDGSRKHMEKGAYSVDKLDALEEAMSR